ncbi:MAG TPA: serine hydrolase [Candidatus Angelobacter sp.]|nr:serine hydrolase [Candidatus Angelobacter sp.]
MKHRIRFFTRPLLMIIALSMIAAAQTSNTLPRKTVPARELTLDSVVVSLPLGQNAQGQPEPPLEMTLQQLMKTFKIPGLSVAVIDNYKVAWAKGYGVIGPDSSEPVTTRTLFQAGSISKPVAAVGAMWLVEHGKLALDEDVNLKLKSWKVPENEFTKDQKVTLRRLVSHSAGLTVHGFPGYAVGEPVPTLVQIFNGEKPANTAAIRVDYVPGTKSRYSGGGVTIEQQLMMDVTGQPFPQFMRNTVLDKLGMTDSTYEQPLPANRAAQTATGTRADGSAIVGKWHVYPEMAAAGLWTTPTDLAKFAIEIALSKQGKANHILSQKMTQEMLTRQVKDAPIGLAFFLDDKNLDQFGHGGADEGFQAQLIMFADSGKGLAMMGNSDAFFQVLPYVQEAVAKAYGWKYDAGAQPAANLLTLVEVAKGPQAAMEEFERLKQGTIRGYTIDENTLNALGYRLLAQNKIDEAINVFKRNVEEYPKFWNCYDSLGEGYMRAGKKELAIQNYQKSLELNPQNTNGADMLKQLREGK